MSTKLLSMMKKNLNKNKGNQSGNDSSEIFSSCDSDSISYPDEFDELSKINKVDELKK